MQTLKNEPEYLTPYVRIDEMHDDEPSPQFNTLLVDEESNGLYLANTDLGNLVQYGNSYIPMEECTIDCFKNVSLPEALEWYAETICRASCWSGDSALICKLAAEELRRCA